MHTITCRNVNEALPLGLRYLLDHGITEHSRNGPVLVAPGPVCTVYTHPWERVLFSPARDASPFFHFFEGLWMLAGRNDLAFLTQFVKSFGQYSDDGRTVRGAYGHRWRTWFGYDQLKVIWEELRHDPASRRCVLTMWDAGQYAYYDVAESDTWAVHAGAGDLLAESKDKPCNTHIYFDCRGGKLNMTVCCRSNDIWLGAHGANAVHMSMLQEYMAYKVGVLMGLYRQFSNNYHLYTEAVPQEKISAVLAEQQYIDFYSAARVGHFTLVADTTFDKELPYFLDNPEQPGWVSSYLAHVAQPMYKFWKYRRHSDFLPEIWADDWAQAAGAWVLRRQKAKQQKEQAV